MAFECIIKNEKFSYCISIYYNIINNFLSFFYCYIIFIFYFCGIVSKSILTEYINFRKKNEHT